MSQFIATPSTIDDDEQSAPTAVELDPTPNDEEVNTFKLGYVLILLLISVVGCAVRGIYWHQIALATQSTTNRCNNRLSTHLIELKL